MLRFHKSMETFHSVKQNWRSRTPKEKWNAIYNFGRKVTEATVGVRIFSEMKLDWFSYFGAMAMSFHFTVLFYTLWTYYEKDDFLLGLQSTETLGMCISITTIYLKLIGSDRFRVNNLMNFGGKYIFRDDDQPLSYTILCEKLVNRLLKSIIVTNALLMISYCLMSMWPMYCIFVKHQRVTILNMELPFVDFNSDFGFIDNLCWQSFSGAVAFVSNICIEYGSCIACSNIHSVPEVVGFHLNELTSEIPSNGVTLNARLRLRNIFMLLQDFNGHIDECLDTYYWRYFLSPYMLTWSIRISIFGQLVLGTVSGYGCAMCNYLILLGLCYMGHNLTQANERIMTRLYKMPWYLLPASNQRQVGSAIHWFQHSPAYAIGPFEELNFEAASNFTRSIYKFTMLLLKLFKLIVFKIWKK